MRPQSFVLRFMAATVLLCAAGAWSIASAYADDDPGSNDLKTLQRRLTDAGCYSGAVDGLESDDLTEARHACPDQNPVLRVETGMHTAPIYGIGVDAKCSLLATSSLDKTVRLWSLPEGKLQRTIRWPIGLDNAGKINISTLSPDGKLLGIGGISADAESQNTQSFMVVDLESGDIRRTSGLDSDVLRARFSPDGKRILIGLASGAGIRVIDAQTGAILMADRDYHNGVFSMAFGGDGSFITTSYDGKLRRYDPDMKLTATAVAPGGDKPYGIAIEPSGKRAAVGYVGSTRLSYVDAVTLAPRGEAETRNVKDGDFSAPAFSSDGAWLLAGGRVQKQFDGNWRDYLRRFSRSGRTVADDHPGAADSISDILPCGGGFVYSAADPLIGIATSEGATTILQDRHSADMRGKLGDFFTVSADGAAVSFGLKFEDPESVTIDLGEGTLVKSTAPNPELHAADVAGLPVTDWKDSAEPKLEGTPLPMDRNEFARALAVRPDREGFVLALDYRLRAFDAKGKSLWDRQIPGVAWGVNMSADGELVIAAHGDGTIRWYRWSDGTELLALFVDGPSLNWAAWTPSGYYMASPGGDDLLGWHVNRGWDQLADFFPASRFAARYKRPDVVRNILRTRDEDAALAHKEGDDFVGSDGKRAFGTSPEPVVFLLPEGDAQFASDSVVVALALHPLKNAAIDEVETLIDGKRVKSEELSRTEIESDPGGETIVLKIPAPAQDFDLGVVVHAGENTAKPVHIRFVYDGLPREAVGTAPKLWVVAVGVDDDSGDGAKLAFAAADAEAIAETLRAQAGKAFAEVGVMVLGGKEADKDQILSAIDWIGANAAPEDVGVLFMAGRAVADAEDHHWFLPSGASTDALEDTAISGEDLIEALRAVNVRSVLMLDACRGAPGFISPDPTAARQKLLDQLKGVEKLTSIFACKAAEPSWELPDAKHGAFAQALLEGLDGRADLLDVGRVTLSGLSYYLTSRVRQLTDGKQNPIEVQPENAPDFTFTVTK